MDIHKAFKQGAQKLAANQCRYTTLHKSHGIEEHHWNLITSDEYWSTDEARQIRSIIASVAEVSMTIAGMPAIPLPGHYVAALIAEVVSPVNRMLACTKAPDTFSAVDASGLIGTSEVKPMSVQQLMALVLAYSGDYQREPIAHRLSKDVAETVRRENVKKPRSAET